VDADALAALEQAVERMPIGHSKQRVVATHGWSLDPLLIAALIALLIHPFCLQTLINLIQHSTAIDPAPAFASARTTGQRLRSTEQQQFRRKWPRGVS